MLEYSGVGLYWRGRCRGTRAEDGGAHRCFKNGTEIRMVRFIRLLKLARMLKMGKLVQRIEDMLDLSPLTLKLPGLLKSIELAAARCINLGTKLTVMSHFLGCFWWSFRAQKALAAGSWCPRRAIRTRTSARWAAWNATPHSPRPPGGARSTSESTRSSISASR